VSFPFQPLTPFFTSVTLSLVVAACATSHHRETDSEDTFGVSPVAGYFMLFCGVFFCLAPLLPHAAGSIPTTRFFFMFSPFWSGAFLASVYFFRYRIVITDTTLTIGAFRRRQFSVEDIIDWDVIRGNRSSELVIYLRSGEKLRISGLVADFDEVVGMVNSHMAIRPHGSPDSAAKLRDRADRVRNARGLWWVMLLGLALVVAALYVTSRLH
jgi:hypothetical protein